MKIIRNDAAYVQKNDLVYLMHESDSAIPASVVEKFFENGMVIVDDRNRYEFVEFTNSDDIKFFENIDWMVNYDEVKDLSQDEFIALGQKINEEKNVIAIRFNTMSDEDKKDNMNMVSQCKLLDFKFYSLRDVLWFKQGHIKMELPEGIEYPSDYVKNKGIKGLVKKIFPKKVKTEE